MSLAAVKIASFEALRAKTDARSTASQELLPESQSGPSVLSLGIPAIDQALPDGGLPRGAVVELTSNLGLGRVTSFALAACAAAQRLAKLRSGNDRTVGAWCAFLDPSGTLNAPGVARAGVDLDRLLVVRPSIEAITRVAVRAASSRAFSMIAIDTEAPRPPRGERGRGAGRAELAPERWTNVVRRLAIAIEGTDTTVLLLTDSAIARSAALPTAMRIELEVIERERISTLHEIHTRHPVQSLHPVQTLRIAKERRGRISGPIAIAS